MDNKYFTKNNKCNNNKLKCNLYGVSRCRIIYCNIENLPTAIDDVTNDAEKNERKTNNLSIYYR